MCEKDENIFASTFTFTFILITFMSQIYVQLSTHFFNYQQKELHNQHIHNLLYYTLYWLAYSS